MIVEQITSFTQNAGRLTAIGLGFFFVTAVMLMMTIDVSLNRLFRVQRPRPMLQQVRHRHQSLEGDRPAGRLRRDLRGQRLAHFRMFGELHDRRA